MTYEDLDEEINSYIPIDSKVLANLNLDYFFTLYQLYDYRNLSRLKNSDLNFSQYIEMNNIEYIILSEEMTYIHESNGRWNILYGELDYYPEMMAYLEENCILLTEFSNPTYGMRISKYIDVYPWYTKIYKVSK